MVFTGAVPAKPRPIRPHAKRSSATEPPTGVPLTRRRALAGIGLLGSGAALTIAGCTPSAPRTRTADQAATSDPIGPLYTETLALITAYDQAIVADPDATAILGHLREEHRQHAVALAGLMGALRPSLPPSTGASDSPSAPVAPADPAADARPSAGSLKQLSAVEKTAQLNAVAAVKAAPAARAATLASIAACRATHVAALGAMR